MQRIVFARDWTSAQKNPVVVKMLEEIRSKGREIAAYDLARAMEEAAEVIAFAKQHKHPTAYFFAVRHRAHLSGLLVDKIQLEPGVDLRGSLERAQVRVLNVTNITLNGALPPPSKTPIRWGPHIAGDREPSTGSADGQGGDAA